MFHPDTEGDLCFIPIQVTCGSPWYRWFVIHPNTESDFCFTLIQVICDLKQCSFICKWPCVVDGTINSKTKRANLHSWLGTSLFSNNISEAYLWCWVCKEGRSCCWQARDRHIECDTGVDMEELEVSEIPPWSSIRQAPSFPYGIILRLLTFNSKARKNMSVISLKYKLEPWKMLYMIFC